MALYQKFFQAAAIDLEAAKILTKENMFQPALYHLQQAYEKCIKSFYIFIETTTKGVPEDIAYENCRRKLGHDTEESTINLLQDLAQKQIDKLQEELGKRDDPTVIRSIQALMDTINRYRKSVNNMVKRLDLEKNYRNNVRDYAKTVENLYYYNLRFSSEVISKQPQQNLLLIDLAMATLYPCFYKMEQITRYPLTQFSYGNLDLLTNIRKPCENIIEMLRDLFVLVKPFLS